MSRLFEKIALLLWRDRYSYDPASRRVTQDHNVSLLTRSRRRLAGLAEKTGASPLMLAIIGGLFAIGAALIPLYLDRAKAGEQVNPNAGELLLRCTQKPDKVLVCHQINGKDQVVTGANDKR
ncbi:Uncharacterized protein ChrSV_2358 [Chromobacterium vaccinii]|nr:Uncharacterized protein ChrSW_2358 [Chromobacterium vaccinii]QND89815.1 Uncharacterized protein ChrSV_2358 [Chromobacterium vaccinii]